MNKVVYTCICGEYDRLVRQRYYSPDYDYVCFTDNTDYLQKGNACGWKILPLAFDELDNTRNNRWHKFHPHILFPGYDISIYIDANINILSSWLFELFEQSGKDLMLQHHHCRSCVYDEAELIKEIGKDTPENVDKMLAVLAKNGMPKNYGLTENNIICRRNTPLCRKIMEDWWGFVRDYCKRDQMSLTYVLWRNGIRIEDISFDNLRYKNRNVFCPFEHIPYVSLREKAAGRVSSGNQIIFYFLGLPILKIKAKPNKRLFYFGGIKVLSEKTDKTVSRFYLLGFIFVFCKKHKTREDGK